MDDRRWITLLNGRYKSLLENDRTYAAFVKEDVMPLLQQLYLAGHRQVFDPMSGYGSLIQYCYELKGMGTFGVELNAPSYLWQVLNLPQNAEAVVRAISTILRTKKRYKRAPVRCEASDQWFTETGKDIVLSLFRKLKQAFSPFVPNPRSLDEISLALLLPFAGRLGCFVKPNASEPHVKQMGTCVYFEYEKAFTEYLEIVAERCQGALSAYNGNLHTVFLGDCASVHLDPGRFTCMITSPPYPNSIDYNKLFGPENYLLHWLQGIGEIAFEVPDGRTIGTNVVSQRVTGEVKSRAANEFLRSLSEYKKDELARARKPGVRDSQRQRRLRKIVNDNHCYYVPYFKNYFADLENAYDTIAQSLNRQFEGYIIVTDNSARDFTVPVSDCIRETWERLGFEVTVSSKKEKAHIGTKNPAAKGSKAKHTEYVIRVSR